MAKFKLGRPQPAEEDEYTRQRCPVCHELRCKLWKILETKKFTESEVKNFLRHWHGHKCGNPRCGKWSCDDSGHCPDCGHAPPRSTTTRPTSTKKKGGTDARKS